MNTTIKTFEDAAAYLGIDTAKPTIEIAAGFPEQHLQALMDHAKLVIISQALNREANDGKDWTPDWSNWDERKYYPWFEMGSPSGAGFAFYDCGNWTTLSNAGSRLCFKSRELAKYAGEQFIDLYKSYFVL